VDEDKRDQRVMIRFSEEEASQLRKLAEEEGLSLAAYVRRAALLFMRNHPDLVERLMNVRAIGTVVDKSQATELSSTSNMPPYEAKREK